MTSLERLASLLTAWSAKANALVRGVRQVRLANEVSSLPQLVRRPIQQRCPNLETRALQGDNLERAPILLIALLQDERDHSQLLRSLTVECL